MTLHVNNAGSFIEPDEVFVKDGGVWRTIKETHVNDNGTWRKIFPVAGNQTFTSGTSSFVVPQGVYSINTTLIVGGGGGGASLWFCGDGHSGEGGGSGGYRQNVSISTTPGETLTMTVGAGGAGGNFPGVCAGSAVGASGGTSSIKRGATALTDATGGIRGDTFNSNWSFGAGVGGPGGSPNGVAGSGSPGFYSNNQNGPGGSNGTGYGTGGIGSGGGTGSGGGVGIIQISW